jgi:hypothetical protein
MLQCYNITRVAALHLASNRVSKDEPMFKLIPDNNANEAYEVVPASYPAGWWTVMTDGIPIRHFGDKGKAERYASDPEYRASVVSRRL